MTTTTSRPVSMIYRNYNTNAVIALAPPLVVVHALIVIQRNFSFAAPKRTCIKPHKK